MSDRERPDPIRLSVEQAHQMVEEQDAAVLDVVDTHSFEETEVKVKGAIRIDPEDVPEEYERVPRDRSVLTY